MNTRRILSAVVATAALAVLLVLAGCAGHAGSKALYHCPMHPQVTSDKPGDCPICGMRLVPTPKAEAAPSPSGQSAPASAPAEGQAPAGKVMYRSTMNPNEVSDHPGKDSMGMDMVPFTVTPSPAEASAPAGTQPGAGKVMYRSTMNPSEVSDHPGKDSMGMDMVPFTVTETSAKTPAGLAEVSVPAQEAQRMGLTYGTVWPRALAHEVRTSARIVPDETRLYRVTTKVGGWVDHLFVNVTGQAVAKGQPLLRIYSPELVASQQELLSALSASKGFAASPYPSVSQGGADLLEAVRRRLELWDLTDDQIARIEKTGQVEKGVTLYAPASGYVSEKDVLPGQKIMPGEPLMVIADLGTVWAEADIYESDLPYIKVGMPAKLTLPYWPGKEFDGRISFLNPFLDPQTRTLKARLTLANPGMLLRPEMYGTALLSYPLGDRLAVPEDAVLPTGEHHIVFKAGADGRLTPVDVTLGPRAGGYFEVLSGLSAGDRVVTSANFLIDSESSLKAALQAVAGS